MAICHQFKKTLFDTKRGVVRIALQDRLCRVDFAFYEIMDTLKL